jgi:hypothetical protein
LAPNATHGWPEYISLYQRPAGARELPALLADLREQLEIDAH